MQASRVCPHCGTLASSRAQQCPQCARDFAPEANGAEKTAVERALHNVVLLLIVLPATLFMLAVLVAAIPELNECVREVFETLWTSRGFSETTAG